MNQFKKKYLKYKKKYLQLKNKHIGGVDDQSCCRKHKTKIE